jgi:hypothetical protein
MFPVLVFAQDQPPQPFTIRVNTQLVIQAVSVTDKEGKIIPGLTADDFVLTEDNVPQNISVFEFQKIDDTVVPRSTVSLGNSRRRGAAGEYTHRSRS